MFKGVEDVMRKPCVVVEVPNQPAAEIILAAEVSRGTVQRKKLYQDSVGNYARPDIWSVTWHNKPKDILFTDTPIAGFHEETGLWDYDSSGTPFDRD